MLINLNLDLSKIPSSALTEGKNKHSYVNLTASSMKEPDDYGNNMSLYIQQSKEDRDNKVPRVYVGTGKSIDVKSKGGENGK